MVHDNGAARPAANPGARPEATLEAHGIRLKNEKPGRHRTACPACQKGKADTALSVTVKPDGGVSWKCFRCGWKEALRRRHGFQAHDRRCPRPVKPPEPEAYPIGLAAPWKRLWHQTLPITAGNPVATYLQGRRCVLPHPDADLRSLPGHRHPSGYIGPAMIGLVTDAVTGEPMNLHQTWLTADGSGKAPLERSRLVLQGHRLGGGVVRLVEDAEVTVGLAIAEGIETALTALRAGFPCWSCLHADNIAKFPVLPGIEALTIVADRDPINARTRKRTGTAAAERCTARWTQAGVEVRLWESETEGADFNDLAREVAA
jgi:putative DNA primase/helicase